MFDKAGAQRFPMQKHIFLILLLIPLAIFALATLYVRYAADDFCLANSTRSLGVIDSTLSLYRSVNGRFAYHLAVSLVYYLPFIGLPALATLALWSASVLDIGRQLKLRPELSLAILLAVLSAVPNLIQVLYWQSGLFVYGFALALFCLLVSLILRKTSPVICAILAFIISGFSDTVSVAVITILGLLLLWGIFGKDSPVRPFRSQISAALIGAGLGFALVFFAPGTAARRAGLPATDLGQSFIFAARASSLPFVWFIRQHPLILFAMLVVPWGLTVFSPNPVQRKQLKLWLLFSLLGLLVVNYVCYLLSYVATSYLLTERAQSVPMFFTMVEIAFLSYVAGRTIPLRVPKLLITALILLLVLLFSSSAIEVTGKLRGYAELADARATQIRSGITQVKAIDSDYVLGGDLGDSSIPSNIWINECMRAYYGVEKIERKAE